MEDWFSDCGAAAWGAVDYGDLLPFMDEHAQTLAEGLCPETAGVFVAAFPYFSGLSRGNLSLYAQGEDYHLTVIRRLESACGRLRAAYPAHRFVPGADSSPLPEKTVARLAGVGLCGQNTLVLLPPYGSYVFLGTVLTDLPLETTAAAPDCRKCGQCVAACPSGALSEHGVDREKCLSHITQKKGVLSQGESALLQAHPTIWGCDLCQNVCPYNQGAALSPLPEFREALLAELNRTDLEGLSNRQFAEKYGNRAFSWRGPGVLRRNLTLKEM